MFVRGAAESLVLCGAAKPAGVAAQKWFETESAAGGAPSAAVCLCLAQTRAATGDVKGALAALDAAPKDAPPAASLLRAALLVRADRKDDARKVLETLAGSATPGFERSAAQFLAGGLPFGEFEKLGQAPGRANDVAWIESVAAEMKGDAAGAAVARDRAAEASKPPGEFPGLVVRPAPAK
jgi:hypothetical protein